MGVIKRATPLMRESERGKVCFGNGRNLQHNVRYRQADVHGEASDHQSIESMPAGGDQHADGTVQSDGTSLRTTKHERQSCLVRKI